MSYLEQFKIDLISLNGGDDTFEFDLDDTYFEAIEAPMVRKGRLHTTLNIRYADGCYAMDFHTKGSVVLPCDLCLDDMEQEISTDNHLTVQFGEGNSEDDDLVILNEDEGILDVSWYIYEFIELSIPLRHVHAPGKCNPAMMKILEEHSAARSGDGDDEKPMDSRWEALSKLKSKE
ncbi:MAG: YceD family protein [Prevotella sp.]